MEPFVKILYSESAHAALQIGSVLSLGNANSVFEDRDLECAETATIENIMYEITYGVNDEQHTYCCSQNLGDGDGSVINHLRKDTLEQLEMLSGVCALPKNASTKNPFSILKTSCQNMLQFVLPQLEAYCLAHKTQDVVWSFHIDNSHPRIQEGLLSIMHLIQNETDIFLKMLEDMILKNPDNVSLISAVETLIDKTEKYADLIVCKANDREALVDVLKRAMQRAAVINENSILNCEPPPPERGVFVEDVF